MKFKIKYFTSVRSTNDEAIKYIKKNNLNPTIILAKIQTNGKGTMGKKWVSRKGNIFMSIYFMIDEKKIKFEQFSILNPYIIKKILKKYTDQKIKIKLPNDILIKSKKLCGILQEVISFKNKKYLIIGIGINSVVRPLSNNFNATSLLKNSNFAIKNKDIVNDIKKAYEKILSGISRHKIKNLMKYICEK
jgi:BirA family transcriptional regulator, biotin operon repressor / biotin---[acetyl-CoA-carboxylase] ligase